VALWGLFRKKGAQDRFAEVRKRCVYLMRCASTAAARKQVAELEMDDEEPPEIRLPMPSEVDSN